MRCCCSHTVDAHKLALQFIINATDRSYHQQTLIKSMQVELPLGATEDRICGTIDIEKALMEGIKAYEPGLLVRVLCLCV